MPVFYDPLVPFQGRSREVQRERQASTERTPPMQSLGYSRVAFDRAFTGGRVFTVHIVNTRTTYQFTRAVSIPRASRNTTARDIGS